MVKYHPTEYGLKGKGKYYYILYEHLEKTRSGKKVWKPRAKRVYVSGTLLSYEVGIFTNKLGRRVYGVRIRYLNPRNGFTAHRHGKRYKVKRTYTTVTKIVPLPKNIRKVRLTASKREAEPTLPAVY